MSGLKNKLVSYALIPLAVLTLYFVSFYYFLSWLLPEFSINVNRQFVGQAWKYSFLLLLLFALLYLIIFIIFEIGNKKKGGEGSKSGGVKNSVIAKKFFIGDVLLLLLPLTPIVQYILNNQDILSFLSSLYILAVFTVFSAIFIILIPILFRFTNSNKVLMHLGLAFSFTVTNMAFLSAEFHWYESGSLGIQLLFLSAVFLVSWVIYNFVSRKFLYFIVIAFFIANSVIQVIQLEPNNKSIVDSGFVNNKLIELIDSHKPQSTPNIYLLVYDAYVANEVMLGYGIDNSAQEEYLEKLGFNLYPRTYSVGTESLTTMNRVLNASTEFYGSRRRAVSGDGVVQNLLKSFGYETYGLFSYDYFFRGNAGSKYDVSFPKLLDQLGSVYSVSSHQLLSKAILMGEFRFDVGFRNPSNEQFIEYKLDVFKDTKNPKFIYTHSKSLSHSQNSGVCLPDETQRFEGKLKIANAEMKQDIETIIQNNSDAIIIVLGDHGPYLTKNCVGTGVDYATDEISRLDIQDRYGAFLAIKWPTEDFVEYDDITILQDLFPSIFAYLFKDNQILEAKIAPLTLDRQFVSQVWVDNGIIHGGINDGEPLYIGQE